MNINDKFERQKISGKKIKQLKGHVKLTLKDAKTGEVQKVVEGDNIVTNALPDIVDNNYFGCLDFNAILPLYSKWFAGSLLYTDPFPVNEVTEEIDPNNYFIKNDSINHLVAHAGDTFSGDIRDDPKRGMPNTYLQNKTPNSVTMAWEWGPTQGNGQISAVALCHKDVGNCGTGSNSNAFKTLDPFAWINNSNLSTYDIFTKPDTTQPVAETDRIMGQLDDRTKFYINVGDNNEEYRVAYGTDPNGGTHDMTAWIVKMGAYDIGLQDTQHGRQAYNWWTFHNVNFTWWHQPQYSWDAKHKTIWLFSNQYVGLNPSQTRYIFKRSPDWVQAMKIWFTLTDGAWVPHASYHIIYPNAKDIGDVSNGGSYTTSLLHQQKDIGDGQYQDIVYFPYYNNDTDREDPSRLIRFNLQNQADVSYINVPVNSPYFRMCGPNDGDLIIGHQGVINDSTCYRANSAFNEYSNFTQVTPSLNSVSTLAIGEVGYNTRCRWIVANKMVHTTMFNLPNSVMKTASQTMELEYTLTEVD